MSCGSSPASGSIAVHVNESVSFTGPAWDGALIASTGAMFGGLCQPAKFTMPRCGSSRPSQMVEMFPFTPFWFISVVVARPQKLPVAAIAFPV